MCAGISLPTSAFFLPHRRPQEEYMKKAAIASIPELKTSVGIHGSTKQKEVGGPMCVAIVVGVAVYTSQDGG
jgi:hypothetical protein